MYGYTMVVLGLLAGWISAKFTVKTALYLAAIISVIGLIGRAMSVNYDMLLFFQIIAAIAYPLAMAPVGTVAESLFKEKSHTVVGISVGILFLGLAVGSFVGPSLASAFGLYGTLWFTAILAIIAALWIFTGINGYPINYKGKSLKGVFKVGMIKNWWVAFAISAMAVMFGGIASEMLIARGFAVGTAIAYGGLLGGLAFLGSALGAILLPPIFENAKKVRLGLVFTALMSFIFVMGLAYGLVYYPNLGLLIGTYFLFGFFGNAYWSMALASTTKYVSDPAQAGFATSMYSVIGNIGVAVIPVYLGPVFLTNSTLAISTLGIIELIALLFAPLLIVTSAAVITSRGSRRKR
jgi:predicted MFS family arabinose efflux permease